MPIGETKTTIIIQTTVPFEKNNHRGSNQIISQQQQANQSSGL